MKKFFVGLVILALSVGVLGAAEQKFSSLPIGNNLDEYISSIWIWYGPLGNTIDNTFRYNRKQDGPLETFAISKLREMSDWFVPKTGHEGDLRGWSVSAITDGIGGLLPYYYGESKPATIAVAPPDGENGFYPVLRNGRWEVPEEVFGKVKFQFGAAPGFYIPGATDLEINLYNGSRVFRFSTRERISDSDSPCVLPATLDAIKYEGVIIIPNEIALAKPSWWKHAEITLYTPSPSAFVTFLVNRTPEDGKAIRWSNPPPSFFVPPSPITLQKTSDGLLELVVTGSGTIEESDSLEGVWRPPYSITSVASTNPSSDGPRRFLITPNGLMKFYRVRAGQSTQ